MSKTLFEEAITDARHLREAAEENAKKAIVEAVTPRIRDFIEQHLVGGTSAKGDFLSEAFDLNEEDEEVETQDGSMNEEDEDVDIDAEALQELAALLSPKSANIQKETSAALEQLTEDEKSKIFSILKLQEEKENTVSKEAYYEIDLEELRSSVKNALKQSKPLNESASDDDVFEISDSDLKRMLAEDIKITGLPKDIEKKLKDDDIQLSAFIETEDEEGEEGEAELGEPEPEADVTAPEEETPVEPEGTTDEVYEIDESVLRRELVRLRGLSEGRKSKKHAEAEKSRKKSIGAAAKAFGDGTVTEMDEIEMNKLAMESRNNRALENKLNEYRSAVQTLRGQLSEMNLFNCKLLYVNKILQNKEVTSSQRRTIIEALDGAKSIREAKLLYESLSASLTKENTSSLNESIGRLSPGSSSRTTGTASPRSADMPDVDRWARLAGINK